MKNQSRPEGCCSLLSPAKKFLAGAAFCAVLCLSCFGSRGQDSAASAPFAPFIHVETEGAVQALTVSDTALVIDVKFQDGSHVIKAYGQPSGRLLWEKTYVDVYSHLPGPALHVHGGRLAFYAAETALSSSSIGLHVLDLQTGAKLHYTRESPLAARGSRIVSESGSTGNVYDMAQGAYLKKYSQAERLRFQALIGDKVLYLRSTGDDRRAWSPLLLSLADGSESWTDRPFSPEERAFLSDEIPSSPDLVAGGFPVLIRQRHASPRLPDAPLRFFLLTESGPCRFYNLQDFGLSGIHAERPDGVVDFQHTRGTGTNAVLVAGVASPLSAETHYHSNLALVSFDARGGILSRAAVPLEGASVHFSGLDDRGRLLLVLSDERVLAYDLPSLRPGFAREYKGLYFQGNRRARLMGRELYVWGSYEARPSGDCVFSLTTEAGDLSAFYPFGRNLGNLAAFKKSYLDAFNTAHLFLCFIKDVRTGGRPVHRSTIVRIPRANRGWLDASLSVPPPVYTDSAVPVTFSPAFAALSASAGSISGGKTWNTPSSPGTYTLTLSVGGATRDFPVPVAVRIVNKPPVADFILVDPPEDSMFRLVTHFDGAVSRDPDGRIVKYEWSYSCQSGTAGKAFGVNSARESVTFPSNCHSASVTLKVTDDQGLSASKTRRIYPPKPLAVKKSENTEYITAIPPALDPEGGQASVTYRIEVKTGTRSGAGTDANVRLALYGPKRADGMRLRSGDEWNLFDPSKNWRAHFENGKTDTFRLTGKSLDDLEFITLRHDNTGDKPGWFVERLSVKNETTGKERHFVVNQWLAFNEGPKNRPWYKFTPLEALFGCGIVFGSERRSAGLTAASDNVFILPENAQEFYITSTDRAQQIAVFNKQGVLLGQRYSVGSGEAEFPYLTKNEWGVKLKTSDFPRPTPLTVRLNPGGKEALVWVFPSSWRGYESEARQLALLLPLEGRLDGVFDVALEAESYLRDHTGRTLNLNPILEYGAEALALFEDIPDIRLEGLIKNSVPIYALKCASVVAELLGKTVSAAAGELSSGLLTLISAAEWAGSMGNAISKTTAPTYAAGLLERLAGGLDSNLLQTIEIFRVLKQKTSSLLAAAGINDAAECRSLLDDIEMIALGPNPGGSALSDHVISYADYGMIRRSGIVHELCLASRMAMGLENIKRWNREGHSDFDDPYFQQLDAEGMFGLNKVDATRVAMAYYQPVIDAMIKAASIFIGASALN
ncbi:MAG: hypothetical protein JW747_03915 [Candidatus Aminicenantes bacterium]|nr:hypothetical protein [Candidatus Aminicenantes bacterium]